MEYPQFDKTVHEQTKLKILTYLSCNKESSFMNIKTSLKLTSGNLSIQLKTLESKDLIKQTKTIENRKTNTTVRITKNGKQALLEYFEEMENLLSQIKRGM
ncbi:MAG: transcriptional regulator [Sphaerochaetaceae bacterium]|nr:transcriptional regulator [Sphaerochaetaceae bacterium]